MKRPVLAFATALTSGVIFGIGLSVGRMTDPEKIKDFLDFAAIPAGGWDPSLLFVMGGALIVTVIGLRLDRLMRAPWAAPKFAQAERSGVDRTLIVGAASFGVGWGLAGLCPGPAIADLGLIPQSVWPYTIAMFAGSWAAGYVREWRRGRAGPREVPAR